MLFRFPSSTVQHHSIFPVESAPGSLSCPPLFHRHRLGCLRGYHVILVAYYMQSTICAERQQREFFTLQDKYRQLDFVSRSIHPISSHTFLTGIIFRNACSLSVILVFPQDGLRDSWFSLSPQASRSAGASLEKKQRLRTWR